MGLRKLITILAVTVCSFLFSGNEPLVVSLNDEDGLPSNEVYQMVQDSFGYLWIGCDAGLFRYDGFEFRKYKSVLQSGRSISGLQLDKQGRLWCKNFTGQIFRSEGDSLRLICDLKSEAASIVPYYVADDNLLYVGLNNRVNVYNDEGDSLRTILLPVTEAVGLFPVRSLITHDNKVYCSVPERGIFVSGVSDSAFRFSDSIPMIRKHPVVFDFFLYGEKVYCQISDIIEGRFDYGCFTAEELHVTSGFKRPDPFFRVLAVVPEEEGLWLCTSSGVNRFESPEQITYDSGGTILRKSKVTWTISDREGQRWFSTLTDGLKCVPSPLINHLTPENSNLPEKHFTAVSADRDGSVIIGGYSGRIYRKTGPNFTEVESGSLGGPVLAAKRIVKCEVGYLISRGVTSLHDFSFSSAVRLSMSNARDLQYFRDSIFIMLPEGLWGIARQDANSKSTTVKRRTGGRSLCVNPNDSSLYCSFNDGVFQYGANGFRAVIMNNSPVYANELYCDSEVVWTAGISDGVNGILNGKVVKSYNTGNGLEENEIRHISGDSEIIVAASSEKVYIINTRSDSVNWLDKTNGINPKDINSIDVAGGMVYMATGKGLLTFPISLQCSNGVRPTVAIEHVAVNGLKTDTSGQIEVPYGNYNVRIRFTSVALRSGGKYNVRYRLLGADSAWIEIPAASRTITLSGVPTGNCIFELQAINERGLLSEPVRLHFHVTPPVWQTWWFYLFASCLVIGLVIVIALWRFRVVKRNEEVKRQLVLSQLTALKAQMNPHFMYNALNSIQDLVLQRDIRNSSAYLSKFSKLMRAVLSASDKQWTTVNEEIGILEPYLELEKLRMGDQFTFSIIAASEVQDMRIPSMIIQPYVENALKHGLLHSKEAKKLEIVFELGEQLKCRITDNGIGRERSAEINQRQRKGHTSFAGSANEKRLELLSKTDAAKYSVQTTDLYTGNVPSGTSVELTFPVIQ